MTDFGTRAQVFHGNAMKTTGGLRKKDLYKNKRGRIVSMKKSRTAKNWNPLKMLGLLSKSGEPFGARTFRKGSVSRTRRGAYGQSVLDFFTHKGSRIKRNGKKYKAYYSRKGSVRKTNKWKRGRDYSQSGGMTALNPSSYPVNPPSFDMPSYTPQEIALMAASGGRSRSLSGGNSLSMTNIDSAYPSQFSNIDMGMRRGGTLGNQRSPIERGKDALRDIIQTDEFVDLGGNVQYEGRDYEEDTLRSANFGDFGRYETADADEEEDFTRYRFKFENIDILVTCNTDSDLGRRLQRIVDLLEGF